MSTSRFSDFSVQTLAMGVLVAIVGFTSSFAIVLQGLRAAGASDAQAASGLMALSIAMGISGIWLSFSRRMPISVAWSTPGAALLIASGDTLPGFAAAVGAFVVCALLLLLAGLYRPLGRAIEAIPSSLANAMLAGILLTLCLAPIRAIAFDAWLALPVILAWWSVGQFYRLFAVPAALLMLIAVVAWRIGLPSTLGEQLLASLHPRPVLTMPEFDMQAIISIAIPLFVVTMASQNVPGMAVMRANGYTPPAGPLIANTAGFSLLATFFGGHAVNLAAITAAMCAGEDSHTDPARRYWSAIIAGLSYVLFGLLAGAVAVLVTLIPSILIEAIAGLALIGAFTAAIVAAFHSPHEREAAAVTFLFAGSGLAFMGVGGAFWGLLAGGGMVLFKRRQLT
jgi:benzoate membrane transport protein